MATCLQVRCVGCRLAHPSSPLQGPGPGPTCKSGAGWTAAKAAAAQDLSRTAPDSKRWGFRITNGGWPWDFHRQKWGELISNSRRIIGIPPSKMQGFTINKTGDMTTIQQNEASWSFTMKQQDIRYPKKKVCEAKRRNCQTPNVSEPLCQPSASLHWNHQAKPVAENCQFVPPVIWYVLQIKTCDLGFQNMLGQKGTAMKFNLESKMSNHENQWYINGQIDVLGPQFQPCKICTSYYLLGPTILFHTKVIIYEYPDHILHLPRNLLPIIGLNLSGRRSSTPTWLSTAAFTWFMISQIEIFIPNSILPCK